MLHTTIKTQKAKINNQKCKVETLLGNNERQDIHYKVTILKNGKVKIYKYNDFWEANPTMYNN